MSNKKQEKLKSNKVPAQKVVQTNKQRTNKTTFLWMAGIVLLTYIAFFPSLKNGFTNWDDNVYIADNSLIKSVSAANIKKIFNIDNPVSYNYHPIAILSLALDYKLSGYHPKIYHVTNLIIHLLNTALVFWFILLLSERKIMVAAIVAYFFAIHPMHVESVAWISERKDVLYVFFFISALIVYYKYLQHQDKRKWIVYVSVLILFILSVLSKAMAVVFPLILLLMDYYTGRKLDRKAILEKIPFFMVSIFFGLLAVHIQSSGAIAKFQVFTLLQRFCFASYGIIHYIYNLFLPINLSSFYQYPALVNNHLPIIFYIVPFIVIALFSVVIYMAKRNKVLFFGFSFFIITIAMVLQFISVGKAIMAERYTYLSYIGLLFVIAMGYDWLQNSTDSRLSNYKKLSSVLGVVLGMFFFYQTYEHTKIWENSDVLWTDAIKNYPDDDEAYRNRGHYLINKGSIDIDKKNVGMMEYDRAFADFNMAIQLNPTNAKDFVNRANIYGIRNQFDLSLRDYSKAIELDSTDAEVFTNRGVTYVKMKQYDKAIADYNKAITINPNYIPARKYRAYLFVSIGNYEKAIVDLNELLKLDTANADYYFYKGNAYYNLGDFSESLINYTTSISLKPNNSEAYLNRSMANKALGKFKDALDDAEKSKSLGYAVDTNYLNELRRKLL